MLKPVITHAKGGLLKEKLIDFDVYYDMYYDKKDPDHRVNYINDHTGIINDGSRYIFKGIIRGCDDKPVTYFFDKASDLLKLVSIDEWIYYVKGSG